MVYADISIFASSHFVPLGLQQNNATNNINGMEITYGKSDEVVEPNKQITLCQNKLRILPNFWAPYTISMNLSSFNQLDCLNPKSPSLPAKCKSNNPAIQTTTIVVTSDGKIVE